MAIVWQLLFVFYGNQSLLTQSGKSLNHTRVQLQL